MGTRDVYNVYNIQFSLRCKCAHAQCVFVCDRRATFFFYAMKNKNTDYYVYPLLDEYETYL